VAHIIERGSAEFPQKYGKPIVYSDEEFISRYGEKGIEMVQEKDRNIIHDKDGYHIPNRLAFDVEYYAKKILALTENRVGNLYSSTTGKTPLVYYWVRTAKCSNPSCQAEIPMLKQFYISKRRTAKAKDWYYLSPIITGNKIDFEIKNGECSIEGWNHHGNLTCPCCGNITNIAEIKRQFNNEPIKERLLAIIEDGDNRNFRTPVSSDLNQIQGLKKDESIPKEKLAQFNSSVDAHPVTTIRI
jgi:adenine-specific DNA methylase